MFSIIKNTIRVSVSLSVVCLIFNFTIVPVVAQTTHDATVAKTSQDSATTTNSVIRQVAIPLQNVKPEFRITFVKIIWAIIIFFIGYFVIRILTRLFESFAERWVKMRLPIKRIVPIVRIFGWTFILYIIIADVFAPPIQTLIAVTASAGIAIGFASQDILKNIFGGIMILFDRPFQVGDKINVDNYYGEVIGVGLRTVRIVTPDDSVVSIPNSEIVNQSVSNANSGATNCQVVAEFFLTPDADLTLIRRIAYRTAVVSRYVYLNKPIAIIFKNEIHEGRSLIKMRLKAYVLDIRFEFPFMSEMTELFMQELFKRNLVQPEKIPYIAKQ
ncbi:mechanosensitive ion channel [candidate division KSB1 bacterium]|nr:mechanosensitive ion channel [candidate division KSB1 bacterium]